LLKRDGTMALRGAPLDFCAERGIVADIEMIRANEVDEAYERALKGDVKYRFVIDNASLAIAGARMSTRSLTERRGA
jgi:uncharacterized zinc-type alcohol dehydrogenase-like protein